MLKIFFLFSPTYFLDSESESLLPGPSTENENAPLLGSRGRSKSRAEPVNDFPDEPEYNQLVKQVETAINRGILPERIYQENFSTILI